MSNDKIIDKKTVEHIARLSKIKLTDAEKERLIPELNNILSLVSKLKDIPDSVEPLMSVLEVALSNLPEAQEAILPMMPDEVGEKNNAVDLLKIARNAKEMGEGGFFVVPKVVGGVGDNGE
ncbi:MAG: Asp-tRNA(Asn)/Glu-tRNA(Gln) amidotransferase subunit GatC [Hydrotalea sp.]|nr:Asp-tRNA(Asn)/Glu-tRNA(Gln) amidotransferase subunit GatC [Hydrotalea sp.]